MMSEWHVAPDYIAENWTDELFSLMVGKFVERHTKELDKAEGKRTGEGMVDESVLFAEMGNSLGMHHGD